MKGIRNTYFTNRFFIAVIATTILFVMGYPFAWIYVLGRIVLLALTAALIVDSLWLYSGKGKINISRQVPNRLSLNDENPLSVQIENRFPFKVQLEIIEELPFEFQKRNFSIKSQLQPGESRSFDYLLKPQTRGAYQFGQTNVYITGILGLVNRRFRAENQQSVAVYPSFISMRKFELMSISNRLEEIGVKRVRRVGHHSEFDQVREYVPGDDSRTVNWKATARKGTLMVNQYQDERSQQVVSLIDMGRIMEMPFEGMSLLDYAINSSLIISNTAMLKHDRAGLISFSDQIHTVLQPSRQGGHLQKIMEVLYNQQTRFKESSYEKLYATVASKIKQRSLLILFTNFEGLPSLHRQMPFLKKLAAQHLLLVVFFENTEIRGLASNKSKTIEDVYVHSIARKFIYDKKVMANELKHAGIQSLLTAPENLSINLINKYLEIKARQMI